MEFVPQLWFLTGCTAVGKTDLSLELAQLLNGEILSCDSIQVYRRADIGSAKIKPECRKKIPHHGLDLCDPSETFDVGQYITYAQSIVDQMKKKRKNLLVVGGTGFYLKSFFSNVTDSIAVPEVVRREVQLLHENLGLEGLQRSVASYGPVDLNASDWHNPRRLLNILGKQKVTGLSQLELKQKFSRGICPFASFFRRVILLERHSESLEGRIEGRMEEMFGKGLVEEVKNLGHLCPPLGRAIAYRQVKNYLENPGKITEKELKQSIIVATRQLVKKQRTWFRRQIPIDYSINLDEHSFNESFDFIGSFCKNNGIWI
ncbi:MAG: tRNA (adenosine(37)-N6)-dimethylallyltransferase MiaA [Puniceicoccales bacterium]|jgi:tRNA dimethylallyltransferase|nr:tRNA (adenosine(37)-N6)-dimethylallyltransferase MiaA [Puniceicoccales bacterium]